MNIINPVTAIPSALTAYFPDSCPSGWSEYTEARGRYIVGLPSGGTKEGTAGTALSNAENRPVGQHNHTFSGSALATHTHTFAGDALAAHGHTSRGTNSGATTVTMSGNLLSESLEQIYRPGTASTSLQSDAITDTTGGTPAGTNAAITGGTPAGSIANAGSVAATNAPYIQLICCVKD